MRAGWDAGGLTMRRRRAERATARPPAGKARLPKDLAKIHRGSGLRYFTLAFVNAGDMLGTALAALQWSGAGGLRGHVVGMRRLCAVCWYASTCVPARVLKVDKTTGSIEVGKQADLVLVGGDPSKRIGDLRNTRIVMMGGKLMDADSLRAASGFSGPPKPAN